MASAYDKASLVMLPHATKDGKVYSVKPEDRSGDFTFSRGVNLSATRVNSSGLIEKAKENLLTYSNTFDNAAWAKPDVSVTGGQSGYDGSSDAWLLSNSASFGNLLQDYVYTGVQTFSVYAKANAVNWLWIRIDTSGTQQGQYFDLQNGVLGATGANITASIEAVGATGWYRCSVTYNATSVRARIYPAAADDGAGQATGSVFIQDAALCHGLIAQDYVETTTTAASEGLTEDMPRLDYHNPDSSTPNSCPSLLLEPSRTNAFNHSEYSSAIEYNNVNSITNNAGVSPEGIQNALEIDATGNDIADSYRNVGAGVVATFSVFAKAGTGDTLILNPSSTGSNATATFDLTEGTISSTGFGQYIDSDIQNYGNGWWRCSITFTTGTGAYINRIRFVDTGTYQLYGFQLEAGSYPTSYIPTYGTAASRAYEYPLVNPQTMLGATEGSWFVNFDNMSFDISGTSSPSLYLGYNLSNFIGIANRASGNVYNVQFIKRESGAITNIHTLTPQVGNDKFCFTWNGSNLKLFINGVKVYDDNGFANYPVWDDLSIGYSNRVPRYNNKQTLLFPTQITDEEAIALTTL